ncbi:MAG: hypothetical protein ABIZ56_11285, partial [Chthoniobacteraceae bacterium]
MTGVAATGGAITTSNERIAPTRGGRENFIGTTGGLGAKAGMTGEIAPNTSIKTNLAPRRQPKFRPPKRPLLVLYAQAFESLIPPRTKKQADGLALNVKNLFFLSGSFRNRR